MAKRIGCPAILVTIPSWTPTGAEQPAAGLPIIDKLQIPQADGPAVTELVGEDRLELADGRVATEDVVCLDVVSVFACSFLS